MRKLLTDKILLVYCNKSCNFFVNKIITNPLKYLLVCCNRECCISIFKNVRFSTSHKINSVILAFLSSTINYEPIFWGGGEIYKSSTNKDAHKRQS